MRILSTTMCYPTADHSDQGIFVQRRCLALSQRPGLAVSVLSPQPWCPALRPAPAEAIPGPLPARYPRMLSVPVLGWATDGFAFARAVERDVISETLRDRRPDVIDAHFEYPDGVGAWLAGRRIGIPVVVTVRGKIVSLSRKTLRRMQIAWMLRGVAARVAVSRSLADWIHRVGGNDLQVDVIPNGIDRDVFHPVDRNLARQSLRWRSDARYVLAVGHQQMVKGFDRLLECVADICASVPYVRFVLVGSERGEPRFRSHLHKLRDACNAGSPGNDAMVQLLPPMASHTLNLMYSAADLLVSPSRSEGWCNAISESLACGTPVVATEVGGNREQINSPGLGVIVPNGDSNALSTAVVEALSHPWDRERIAEVGGARTWTDTAKQCEAILLRAVSEQACTPHNLVAEALP